tara:strand:- start:383 stop:538 length:156 start_codon:yes stop_codon:yes gene_type:complete
MRHDEHYSFEVLFQTQMLSTKKDKKPLRTSYLWANIIVVDDLDERCPVIEG